MEDTPNTPAEEPSAANQEADAKTFSQEELNRIVSERVKRENEKHRQELEEAVQNAATEAARQAKLSAQEREKEMSEKQKAQIERKERELQMKENRLAAQEKLDELRIPRSLVDFVVDPNLEVQAARIETLSAEFAKSVNAEVASRTAGVTPKDPSVPGTQSRKVVTSF